MSIDGFVPEPMSAHPHYARQADGIRGLITPVRRPVVVAEPPRLSAFDFNGDAPPLVEAAFNKRVLDVKMCAGPAPFIGDPLWEMGRYVWLVAVDDLGRHVAGEATMEIARRPTRAT